MTENLKEIKKDLAKKLKKERFEHTEGVMYTAAALAMRYDDISRKPSQPGCFMTAENSVHPKTR